MMSNASKPRGLGKRILLLTGGLLLAATAAGAILYGPELLGLIQLGKQIDAISAENTRVGGPWPRASEACVSCHGFNGNAQAQTYPRLAGQPEAYLKKQLQAFVSGERSDPTMTPMALSMSEGELNGLAAHFAKMQLLPNATFHADPAQVKRGEALAKANNCAACHGQQLEGKDAFPRLAGQGYGYLQTQLTRFKSGVRRDASGAMPAVVAALSSQDIDDLAQFIASQ
ncbi:cytochrome c4 [Duganella sp. LX20W]|uniref:Cytochrome c4 n=1 Tax=Rugamonas brunnea TaxID=2758569 RepID=A0A7W2IDG3_9BURK|nr:c-type cytochrome [Rugamonas brunnea]MBA5639389.1 cytochrome c4 [Rugamonas brunnea]